VADDGSPILVTGAGGGIGGVGRTVVELLRERDLPVRAMVHREDERAQALRDLGAQVVVGDLTRPTDVANALDGCRRMLFCMSVSSVYLEAAATVATVARALGALEVVVNLSQMTVSQMTPVSVEESHHQRLHWLSEQVLDWSALPVVHLRPTVFQENPLFTTVVARSVAEHGALPLPFGSGRTSPVAAADVARVAAAVLQDPGPHVGRVLELTGPRSQDMTGVAEEYSRALGKPVTYVDVPADEWAEILAGAGFSAHVQEHLITLARLHRQNRFDRMSGTVESLTGQPARTVEAFVAGRAALFTAPEGVSRGSAA
jgi:uncharacterized protein YbjT (DUF2867 family)